MSRYQNTPFKPMPTLLVAGTPTYLFGSYNDKTGPTFGRVLTDAASSTTATVVFQIYSGNVPVVGAIINVRGTANSAGVFNSPTTGIILSVSCTDAGVCTVTYAISSTTQATTADGGEVEIAQPEIGEALVDGASAPAAAAANNANPQQGRTITATVKFPSAPDTLASFNLQGANVDLDSEYTTIVPTAGGDGSTPANLAKVTTGGVVVGGQASYSDEVCNFRFYRFRATTPSGGTNPTVVAKLNS